MASWSETGTGYRIDFSSQLSSITLTITADEGSAVAWYYLMSWPVCEKDHLFGKLYIFCLDWETVVKLDSTWENLDPDVKKKVKLVWLGDCPNHPLVAHINFEKTVPVRHWRSVSLPSYHMMLNEGWSDAAINEVLDRTELGKQSHSGHNVSNSSGC